MFQRGGGGLNTLLSLGRCTLNLGVGRASACFVGLSFYYIFLHLFGVPKVEYINMRLYWPHPNALVATKSISIAALLVTVFALHARALGP